MFAVLSAILRAPVVLVLKPIVDCAARFVHKCVADVVAREFLKHSQELAQVRLEANHRLDALRPTLDDLIARVGALQHRAEETVLGLDQATHDLVRLHWRLEDLERSFGPAPEVRPLHPGQEDQAPAPRALVPPGFTADEEAA